MNNVPFRSTFLFADSESAWNFFRKVEGIEGATAGFPSLKDCAVLVDHVDAAGELLFEAWQSARCGW